jgi:NAD(P)-dependent dehydrogenase (short-subunit alcohol dehydrogenase family)
MGSASALLLLGGSTAVLPGRTASTASTPLRLAGKGAIVTGGGTGIGRGVALALAAEGCNVIITGRRPAPLDGTVQEAASQGLAGSVQAFSVDASDQDQTPLVREALKAFGGKLVRMSVVWCIQRDGRVH